MGEKELVEYHLKGEFLMSSGITIILEMKLTKSTVKLIFQLIISLVELLVIKIIRKKNLSYLIIIINHRTSILITKKNLPFSLEHHEKMLNHYSLKKWKVNLVLF